MALATALLLYGSVRAQEPILGEEAKQPFVNRIKFEGNGYFSDKELLSRMYTKQSGLFSIFSKPRLRMDFLTRDIATLQAFYHANGFLDATVRLKELRPIENETFVDIIIAIEENEATRVEKIVFHTAGLVDESDLRKHILLKSGVPYNPTMLETDVYTIKTRYFDKGFLGVEVRDSVAVDDKRVRVFFDIDPGPTIRVRNIEIRGNVHTRNSIIKKEIVIKEGEVFRLSKATETQRNLFETGLFREAEILPVNLDTHQQTVDIIVRVSERKTRYVEAGFGVGNVVGSRLVGEFGDRNIFGTGRLVRIKAEYGFGLFEGGVIDFNRWDPRERFYRFDVAFNQRRIFGTKVLFGLNAFIQKDATVEPFVIRSQGVSVGGRRDFTQRTKMTLGFTIESIERSAPDAPADKSDSHTITDVLSRDTRDYILDPRFGGYRELRTELAGGILGGENDFYTITGTIQRYFRLRPGVVFAVRGRGGWADRYGNSDVVPLENRYFTGGGNSVRGYEENSLGPVATSPSGTPEVVGGRVLLLTNLELRFPLPWLGRYNFSAAAFVDGGNVWESLDAIDIKHFRFYSGEDETVQEDYRYSLGLGIRYNTPVGPIRLDYGVPLKREVGVDNGGKWHISLGQIF